MVYRSGGVTCANIPSTKWGCNNGHMFVQMIGHKTNTNEIYYPTSTTQGVNIFVPWTCTNANGCTAHYYIMDNYGTNSDSIELVDDSNPYNVSAADTFSLQYSEGCCGESVSDNSGTAYADVYFFYSSLDPTSNPTMNPTSNPSVSPTTQIPTPSPIDINGCSSTSSTYDNSAVVITNKIYACAGTFANNTGGVYGTGTNSAAALCNIGYHVCDTSNEAASLGLTSSICASIGNINEFFATKETRGTGGTTCLSDGAVITTNDDWAYNDIWHYGC